MENDANYRYKMKTVRKTCYFANFAYLAFHIFYLVLFIIARVDVMIWVDVGAIALYLLYFFILKKRKYYIYALACGNTYFAFVIVAALMLGFPAGFQYYLVALSVVSFFTTYFSRQKDIKGSIVWAGLSAGIYLMLYLITSFNQPRYAIDKWLEMTLLIFHSTTAFLFIVGYMVVFLKYAFSLERKITNESRTDELTQISNRYGLYDFYEQAEEKQNLLLALLDVDDFKNINDKYGHVAGDRVLKRLAEIVAETLDDSFVCRYGGEEFVIVLEKSAGTTPFKRLEVLRKNIEAENFDFEGSTIKITITIGVAKFAKNITLEEWIEMADNKMYSGKKTGKNKTVI
ncbi:MAG: GGDEF domain-containing protein [Bacilli bacterium]|nr:GGDEF domain-containing protein [Bacilli bacterium]